MAIIPPNNIPVELFGRDTSLPCPTDGIWKSLQEEDSANTPFKDVFCPFTDSKCDKIRKARPNPLIGNCGVRRTITARNVNEDWIVCPNRFEQDNIIFKDCVKLIKGDQSELKLTNEVILRPVGNIDFALVNYHEDDGIEDFLGIEVQGMGTSNTGGIWVARNDYLNNTMSENYQFSLNLKDASKKILIQLLHKSAQLSRWRYSLVLVIQDYFLDHLKDNYNIDTHFHPQNQQDFVHIHSYSYKKNTDGAYTLELSEALSTDILGLSMCLISNPSRKYLPHSILDDRIRARDRDGKLRPI